MTRARATAVVIVAGLAMCCASALAQDDAGPDDSRPAAAPAETGPTTDLQSLLEKVAASSGKKFLVATRVPPTIHIGGTSVENPGYALLLSILRNNGLATAEIEGYVNIVPDVYVRQLPLRIVQRDDAEVPDDEWVSRVITVSNGSASRLVPILRPLVPQPGHLSATGQETDDKLLIVASYAKVRHITELVEVLTR